MTKTVLYKYLGTNGTIISPIHLEDIYYVRLIKIVADNGKTLTTDRKKFQSVAVVPEDEVDKWMEV